MNIFNNEFDSTLNSEPRWDKLTAEMLLSFSEWSQGFLPIEQALNQIVTKFGALGGTLSRVKLVSGNGRIIAASGVAAVSASSGRNFSFAYPVIGEEVARLKSGSLILMSRSEIARTSQDPAIEEWLIRRNITNVGFICLMRDKDRADFLELHFAQAPNGAWETACEWGASAFARTYKIRRPGLVTEASAQHRGEIGEFDCHSAPILAPENAAGLTRSEWRVCVLVSLGLGPKSVAHEIDVTVNTIRSHLRKIYIKTNLGSYHQLARQLISQVEQQALHQSAQQLSA